MLVGVPASVTLPCPADLRVPPVTCQRAALAAWTPRSVSSRRPTPTAVPVPNCARLPRRGLAVSSFLGVCALALLAADCATADIQRADCPAKKSGGLVSWTHASMATMPLSSRLLLDTLPTALRCLYHPFVHGLASGKLPLASFQNYVGQDAFFLNSFGDAYKAAGKLAGQRDDEAGQQEFHNLAAGVEDELKLHRAYAEKWKVDLVGVQPNTVTSAYCNFVKDIAAGGSLGGSVTEGGPKISHVCAALAPCMRLYAYLGQTLATAGYGQSEDSKRDNPYAEWVDTYKTPDFEGLAKTLEDLLDRYAEKEEVSEEELLPIYSRAMDLELAFFGAQPGVDAVPVPTLSPAVLAVDFDQTLTTHDTTSVIVGAAMAALPTQELRSDKAEAFNTVASTFYRRYSAKVAATLAAHPAAGHGGGYDAAGLRKFCEEMAVFDKESLLPVVEGGFLKGVTRDALKIKAAEVALQPLSLHTLRAATARGVDTHVVSVNWSQDLILSTLQKELEKEGQGESLAESIGIGPDRLHSPDLVFEGETATGALSGPPTTALDKLAIMQQLRQAKGARGAGDGCVVYVGDSVTDLLAMLEADVGIVVGASATLRQVTEAYGIEMRPLVGALAQDKAASGVVYTAASWHDITLALFGDQALPQR